MLTVIKRKGKKVDAYRLGDGHPVVESLICEGKIKRLGDGTFEIMSQEAFNGGSGKGQAASANDYIKIDSSGFPYPNTEEYFLSNHIHLNGNEYEQIPKPLNAWIANEPMCEEIDYLIKHKGLVINESDPEHYFTAPLWGTIETAAQNAAVVFYSILRSVKGDIEDISFNIVANRQFREDYTVIDEV